MNNEMSMPMHRGSHSVSRQRQLVRRDPAVWPFVWRGLLPVMGILVLLVYAVWPFARGEIEASVKRSIEQVLDDKGLDDVKVLVSGQHVFLSGKLKPGVSTPEVLALAQRATCPTWAGPQICPELVLGQFESSPALPSLAAAPGLPPSAAEAAALKPAERPACERALAEAVQAKRIEFAIGSARLLAVSGPILDQVAQAHQGCKGVVRVEGHTDNLGTAEGNVKLSQACATAVRAALVQRGIAADRLRSEGYGAGKPIADNATTEGRKQNRRIEFKVAEAP